jgi:DNA end-binding protein Ku
MTTDEDRRSTNFAAGVDETPRNRVHRARERTEGFVVIASVLRERVNKTKSSNRLEPIGLICCPLPDGLGSIGTCLAFKHTSRRQFIAQLCIGSEQQMASIWKGSLAFGLVNIPVEAKTAVREDHVSFRMLHSEDMSPVKYERVCSTDGEPVPWSEIVKGYEYEKGKFVVMTDADFKEAALQASKTLEILDFVKHEDIDPRFFDTPYYLVPGKGGEKAYALLREAMKASDSVGIGKVVIRQKQHLTAIRVVGNALVLEIMRFANELVDINEFSFPSADGVRPQELQMAEQLVASLAERFEPEKYTDEYRANLMKIIRAKLKGKKATLPEPQHAEADAQVIDLMARLRDSLKQDKGRGGAVRARAKTAAAGEKAPPRRKRATKTA